MKLIFILIITLSLLSCSTVGTYGTHPVEQGTMDFSLNELGAAIRDGGIHSGLGRRSGNEFFRIMRSDFWRMRQQEIIRRGENRPW